MSALKQLITSKVRVFFYLEDRELTLGTMADDTMMFLRNQFAAEERGRRRSGRRIRFGTSSRVGMWSASASLGPTTSASSGACRAPNKTYDEAAVVRRIFEYLRGRTGYSRIAKLLNAEGAPPPKPYQGRPAGWHASSVNEILHRPLYRGDIGGTARGSATCGDR